MGKTRGSARILGLDLGTNSIGWALIEEQDRKPSALLATGCRVFDPAIEGNLDDIQKGKESPPAAERREKRLMRRQTERRARRQRKVANILQRAGLLPECDTADPGERDGMLKNLDSELRAKYEPQEGELISDRLPYYLRARALDERLEPHELGRALYHLAQRRGFKTNRKAPMKEDEDLGQVKGAISALESEITATGARTLGEYFSRIDPRDARIRGRWTGRSMFEREFEAILDAQQPHHPGIITQDFRDKLQEAFFFQRPLKSQANLIGRCELEEGCRRAPWAVLAAQRFRMLQKVNDLRILMPDLTERVLEEEERNRILTELENNGDRKFTDLRKLLRLPRGAKFNLEAGGEKRIPGNRTTAKLRGVFGERWDAMAPSERDTLIDDMRSIQKDEALKKRAQKAWGLDAGQAEVLCKIGLDEGYCALSRQALSKVLPLMERGMAFATARKEKYGEEEHRYVCDLLPPLNESGIDPRNPVVVRTLSEMRRVVNAVIRKYGKPDHIRLELARDLKRPRKERKAAWEKARENQNERDKARTRIVNEIGDPQPRRDAILRVLLAEECGWRCPYTGEQISMGSLLGEHSQFDIEHIIPYSRCLDDSYVNKTLCYHEENRSRKRNRTPAEAYSDAELKEILERVRRFNGRDGVKRAKLRRFEATSLEEFDSFVQRKLNDTRYATTSAADYLALLYGGRVDANHITRIQAGTGEITAQLRRAWDMNGILGDGGKKTRDDHRHHAVDAVAIACTSPAIVKTLSTACQQARAKGQYRWWKTVAPPWDGFLADVEKEVKGIFVSHKVSKRVNGRLHEESVYSKPKTGPDGRQCHHIRKKVADLSSKGVENIVDPAVKEAVVRKMAELGQTDPKKAFKETKDHPYLKAKNGRRIPIHAVRIRTYERPFPLGKSSVPRYVLTAGNHHMEILEVKDKKGNLKWVGKIVTQLEALKRLKAKKPIVKRSHGPGKRFVMSLAKGETLLLNPGSDSPEICVIRSVWQGRVEYCSAKDARIKGDIKKAGEWHKPAVNSLQGVGAQKVLVTPMGEIRRAND